MLGKVVISLLIITVIITVILYIKQKNNNGKTDPDSDDKKLVKDHKPGLKFSHKNYGVGLMKKSCKAANICNSDVLYPPRNPDVDYGSKVPDDCKCTIFLTPP